MKVEQCIVRSAPALRFFRPSFSMCFLDTRSAAVRAYGSIPGARRFGRRLGVDQWTRCTRISLRQRNPNDSQSHRDRKSVV